MKIKILIVTVIACAIVGVILIIPNPILTEIIYPQDIRDIPEVRTFFNKFGHSVEMTKTDDFHVFLNRHDQTMTGLVIPSDGKSYVTCTKTRDAHVVNEDTVNFLKEKDCFGSKPYSYNSAEFYEVP